MGRSIPPKWRSIRFRLALRKYVPWGVRVVPYRLTKSRRIPTRKLLPRFLTRRCADFVSELANLWRTDRDIQNYWGSVVSSVHSSNVMAHVAKPGHFNDPDMLQVSQTAANRFADKTFFTPSALGYPVFTWPCGIV